MAEVDFSGEIKARYTVICDGCGIEANMHYPTDENSPAELLTVQRKHKETEMGGSMYYEYEEPLHFCSVECLKEYY